MINWLIPALLFVFGAVIGSFLNVCIMRIPDKKSIVYPASHCPSCKTPIAFYDNIPLVSYILLAGRCRQCKTPISFQYFFVELLTPMITLVLYFSFGLSLVFALAALFCYVLLVITVIDLQHQIIPNSISIPVHPALFSIVPVSAVDRSEKLSDRCCCRRRHPLSRCPGLLPGAERRGHGGRRYQAAGHDRRFSRLEGCADCSDGGSVCRNPCGHCDDAFQGQKFKICPALWPLSFPRCFFRPAMGR